MLSQSSDDSFSANSTAQRAASVFLPIRREGARARDVGSKTEKEEQAREEEREGGRKRGEEGGEGKGGGEGEERREGVAGGGRGEGKRQWGG